MRVGVFRQDQASLAPQWLEAERETRVCHEAAVIAKGVPIFAGIGVEDEAVKAWLDRLESDEVAPLPVSGDPTPGY